MRETGDDEGVARAWLCGTWSADVRRRVALDLLYSNLALTLTD